MGQSSIDDRPINFGQLIGQEKIVKQLRGLYKKKKFPQGLLFSGPKGSGKTSIAYIIAQSVQAPKEKFGFPPKYVRNKVSNYPIYELDCGRIRKIEDLQDFISRADYEVLGKGRKVFIFDEAHTLSNKQQDLLLKLFEAKGKNLFIICSTQPERISVTLRSRCQIFVLRPFKREDIEQFVEKKLKKEDSPLAAEDLVDALMENGVTSGRSIANSVDLYLSGSSAEDAAEVEGVASVQSKALIRALGKGEWSDVSRVIRKAAPSDTRGLRAAIIEYLRTVLIESPAMNARAKGCSDAINRLAYVGHAEELNQFAALTAELYTLCEIFSENSL